MLRRPRGSTLFPYTTLFRSWSSDLRSSRSAAARRTRRAALRPWPSPRSEEHTSELQSQSNLVCRLLLEKKKKLNAEQHELRILATRRRKRRDAVVRKAPVVS